MKHLLPIITIACLLLLNLQQAFAETKTTPEPVITEMVCKDPLTQKGPGNLLSSVAQMRTIIAWSQTVKSKIDEEHSAWHNAADKKVKCKKEKGSQYYYCELTATPCKQQIVDPNKKEE